MSFANLHDQWAVNLQRKGVKLPTEKSILGCALLCLFESMGNYIHRDEIKSYVEGKGFVLGGGDPIQVRHLSTQRGFYITKQGRFNYCLNNLDVPHPSFIPDKRRCVLTNAGWSKLMEEYDNMCVNCGSEQGKPMRWDSTVITQLQKGTWISIKL